jgi:phenylacetic acid degradation operon negative regulatory protein
VTARSVQRTEAGGTEESWRRRALGAPSARSLLFTVLGEYVLPRGGAAWSSALIRALGALDVEEKSARQAMARTATDGWLERRRDGRRVSWHLSGTAESLLREGAERIYSFGDGSDVWDDRWVVLVTDVGDAPRDVRRRLATGLAWAGFGTLRPGVFIAAHPERENEALRVLEEAGIAAGAASFIGALGRVGRAREIVRTAWDLDGLEERYEGFIAAFRGRRPKSQEGAFVALTHLVHAWRKFPFLDPGLPTRLLPSRWSGSSARDLFHERHEAWAGRANDWFEESLGADARAG